MATLAPTAEDEELTITERKVTCEPGYVNSEGVEVRMIEIEHKLGLLGR